MGYIDLINMRIAIGALLWDKGDIGVRKTLCNHCKVPPMTYCLILKINTIRKKSRRNLDLREVR